MLPIFVLAWLSILDLLVLSTTHIPIVDHYEYVKVCDSLPTNKGRRRCSALARKQAAAHPTANRPKKLRSWSDDLMQAAIDAVKSGRMGVNRAA